MPTSSTKKPERKTRAYHSPRRQEQAIVTKSRIVQAAMHQLQEKGYADMTLESIAKEAGVAPQTVYAVCGSKKGVLAAILETSVESHEFDKYRDSIPLKKGHEERVRAISHFMTLLMEKQLPGFQLLRGMGVVSPELAEMENDYEYMLYDKSLGMVKQLAEDGMLRKDLSVETATDIYWAVLAPSVHRRLTVLRGWDFDRFTSWMSEMISFLLLEPDKRLEFTEEWREGCSIARNAEQNH